MNKLFVIASTALIISGMAIAPASAKHRKHQVSRSMSSSQSSGTVGMARCGNKAELMGKNGNSGQGSNSLGHIRGGNIGGGK